MIPHCENWVISCLDSCARSYGVFSALARSATRRSSTNCCHSLKFIDVFFARRERTPVYGKCISSRHFDAIGTKTCRMMLYGRFNDILVANRHYLALTDDFSDLDEVLRRFSDVPTRRKIVEESYAHVMSSHTYAHRMRQVAETLAGRAAVERLEGRKTHQ